ncbi:hypothetical protein [Tsuneonella amylolytica]|uniref:hypothetical protein n=1 Tax=Tsuneonella amylolytica TaxID=2338327 RepID=UPI000EA86926|nr:hypothetical protein [Tsuneonella amylolytica]
MIGRVALCVTAACALAACGVAGQPEPGGELADAPATAAAASAPATTATETANGTGCRAGETAIFQCRTGTGETIAVCSAGGGTARYAFGRASPEIELTGGRWARIGYSGGGELQIAFDNGPVRYVVFSRTVRTNFAAGEPNDPAMSDGVVVLRDGRFDGMQTCTGGSAADYSDRTEAALQTLPQSDDLFTDETYRADRPAPR